MSNITDLYFKELFDTFSKMPNVAMNEFTGGANIVNKDDEIVISIDLPGFKKDMINIDLKNDALVVIAENQNDEMRKSKKVAFPIASNIDKEKIEATLEDGVLTITLPIVEESQPIKISIK